MNAPIYTINCVQLNVYNTSPTVLELEDAYLYITCDQSKILQSINKVLMTLGEHAPAAPIHACLILSLLDVIIYGIE